MQRLFNPSSVLVVGVSARAGNLAHAIVRNLIEFRYDGQIFLFGRNPGNLYGHRIITDWNEVPEGIDLAVLLTPAAAVAELLDQCGQKGIRRAVVESGGFGEYREDRRVLETELLAVARRHGIRLVGPNGLGIINFKRGLAVPFMPLRPRMRKGGIALLAQSGGVGIFYLNSFASANLGLDTFVSMGNKLDLNECDYLEYLKSRGTELDLVCLYLEDIKDGRRFFEVASNFPCPLLVQKAAVNRSGVQAAASHTASLAVDDALVSTTLTQAGALRVHDMHTMLNDAKALTLPPMRGNRLLIVSRSGGHAVIAADYSERYGLELPPLDAGAQQRIAVRFRAQVIEPRNPLDLGDLFDFEVYSQLLAETLTSETIDGAVFIHVYEPTHERDASRRLVREVAEMVGRFGKPVYLCLLSDESELAEIRRSERFPIFDSPENALRAVAVSRDTYRRRSRPPEPTLAGPALRDPAVVTSALRAAQGAGKRLLTHEALAVLDAAGFPVSEYRVVRTADQVAASARAVGFPLAMKLLSTALPHKSDVGGVVLNVRDESMAAETYQSLMELHQRLALPGVPDGVLLQRMARGFREVFLGGKRDPLFGPVVMVGLGGVFVEVFRDIAMRLAPLRAHDVEEMLDEVVSFKALRGVRGQPPADLEFLRQSLLRIARLLLDHPEIREIDLNPVKLYDVGQGGMVVDARLVLES